MWEGRGQRKGKGYSKGKGDGDGDGDGDDNGNGKGNNKGDGDGDDPESLVVCLVLSSVCMKAIPPQPPVEVIGPSPATENWVRDGEREGAGRDTKR